MSYSLIGELRVLEKFTGRTWRGKMTGQEKIDIARWETALKGHAVKITHSLNEGEYGGESYIMWDNKTESLRFWYFTTAGFFTSGTFSVEGDKIVSVEEVEGNEQGITRVESSNEIMPDGKMKVTSRYLQNDEWLAGHDLIYEVIPDQTIII